MKYYVQNTIMAALLLMLAGCMAPTWEGMSEGEIADWKGLGFDAAVAHEWTDDGFTPATASGWVKAKFSRDEAKDWSEEKFTAEQAVSWKQADFSLKDAIDARTKGLAPVQPSNAAEPAETAKPTEDLAAPAQAEAETAEAETAEAVEEN